MKILLLVLISLISHMLFSFSPRYEIAESWFIFNFVYTLRKGFFIYSEMAISLQISHADYTSLLKLRTIAN